MKKKSQVDKLYSEAVSAIVKHFVTPSLLVYFLTKTADLVYASDIKLKDPNERKDTHAISMRVLRDIGEPWINGDTWDIEINLRSVHQSIGFPSFYAWVSQVVLVHAESEVKWLHDGYTLHSFMEYFTCLYTVADYFEQVDNLKIHQAN